MSDNDDGTTGRSRVVLPSAQPIYRAAERWRDEFLIDDRSLFSGQPLNGAAAAQELVEAFVDQPDAGSGTFYEKLETQLAEVSADAVQLAAELVYVYYLIVSTKAAKAETKRAQIRKVLQYRGSGMSDLPDDLAEALAGGVANPGTAYNTYRWKMFGYLVRFVEAVKKLPREERQTVFADWEAFQRFISALDEQSVWTQRHALEHLLFPDRVPAVTSRDDRLSISKAFAEQLGGELPVDEIVHRLEPNTVYGDRANVNFYRTPYREQWQKPSQKMAAYISWARRFLGTIDEPRSLWLEGAQRAAAAVAAAEDGGDIVRPLREALADLGAGDSFAFWAENDDATARAALLTFVEYRGAEAIDRFLDHVPQRVLAAGDTQLSIPSALLASQDPEDFPWWSAETAAGTHRLTDGYPHQQSATVGEKYVLYLERMDAIRSALATPRKPWGNRLDAAVLADLLVRTDRPNGWDDAEWGAFDAWRTGKAVALSAKVAASAPAAVVTALTQGPEAKAASSGSLEDLADSLFLDAEGREWLQETMELLEHKRQIIFQGPPGTGKTFLARELAEFLAGDPARVTITQFHPGTSYEDFVQGLRPDPEEPTSFRLVDGPLLRIAEDARAHPEDVYVLLVDEINRGNIPAVFGELYYLLEYRDHVIRLTYGGDFSLPENLFLIGTMNTADRSITALDSALRRRFYVRDLRPGETPVDGMLRNHLAQHDAELDWLADLLDRANSIIKDNDQHVGPSHFMGDGMNETWARRAWDHTVMPTLREVFYRRPELLDQLEFVTLKAAVTHTAGDAATD